MVLMTELTAFSAAALVRLEDFATASTSSALVMNNPSFIGGKLRTYYIRKNVVCKLFLLENAFLQNFFP
jgi:hypothetical protein